MTRPVTATNRYASPHPNDWCWAADGWENACYGSVQDARTTTRGKAAAFYASEAGEHLTDVRVWKRYAVPLSHQDVWDDHGDDEWAWGLHERYAPDQDEPPCPDHPPDGWEPDLERHPAWMLVHRTHPNAIPIWICGPKGTDPPRQPKAPPT